MAVDGGLWSSWHAPCLLLCEEPIGERGRHYGTGECFVFSLGAAQASARAALDLFPIVGRRPEIPIKGAAVSRDTPPHCVLGPRPGRYARRYRLSAPALWHPSRGHPCAARMQTQLNTLRLQSSIFLATSCWNQPGLLCPLMAVMSVAGHWPVPLHMRQPSTSNSQLPLTALVPTLPLMR